MQNAGLELLGWMWGVVLAGVGAVAIFGLTPAFASSHMYWQSATSLIGGSLLLYAAGHLIDYVTR